MKKQFSKGFGKYGSCVLSRKWNKGFLIAVTAAMLLLSGSLFAQSSASRQREHLLLSFCPHQTLSCPISDLFPRKTGQGRSNGNYDSRNIDIQNHIICSTDPPVG